MVGRGVGRQQPLPVARPGQRPSGGASSADLMVAHKRMPGNVETKTNGESG